MTSTDNILRLAELQSKDADWRCGITSKGSSGTAPDG
jgi:hypothetical protein